MADIDTLSRAIANLPTGPRQSKVKVSLSFNLSIKDTKQEVKLFGNALSAAIGASLRKAGPAYRSKLSQLLDETMEAKLPWSGFETRITKRKNKTTATFPRNIVDLGVLKSSKRLEPTPMGVDIVYSEKYAAAVHWGTGSVPARPWVIDTLNEAVVKPDGEVNKLIRRLVEDDLNAQFRSIGR